MLLTDHERDKFATYLEQEAHDSNLLVIQLEKLTHSGGMEAIPQRDAIAYAYVAAKLRSIESQTMGGKEPNR